MSIQATTLNRHLWQQHKLFNQPIGLSILMTQMGFAAKILSREISLAALAGKLGLAGENNTTGDAQKKLDVFSNDVVIDAFSDTGLVAAIASEELDQVQLIACGGDAQYILCIDPLDGSSNTDTGSPVGTIFGFYRRHTTSYCSDEEDALRQGADLIAAGYVLYGASTVLVYSGGGTVDGFTLDPSVGEFLLSHPNIQCPRDGKIYSANLSYYQEWSPQIQTLVDYLGDQHATDHDPYSMRYSGALVADVHRILLEGGLYFYPPTRKRPNGKLRLLYENAPLAFVVEQAGGRASTGTQRILDIKANSIHQRSPLAIGSASEVTLYEHFVREGTPMQRKIA